MHVRNLLGLATMGSMAVALATWSGCGGNASVGVGNDGGMDSTTSSQDTGSGGGQDTGTGGGDSSSNQEAGGGDSGNTGDSGSGGGDSGGGTTDGGGATTIDCPSMPCTGGASCCAQLTGDAGFVCSNSCASTNTLDCLKPSDCSGTNVCCATAVIDDPTGTVPSCIQAGAKSATTACVAQSKCPGNIAVSCDATDVVQLCNTSADCAGQKGGYTDCCQVTLGGSTFSGCVTSLIAGFAGLKCD
jgi:hypothetical protein